MTYLKNFFSLFGWCEKFICEKGSDLNLKFEWCFLFGKCSGKIAGFFEDEYWDRSGINCGRLALGRKLDIKSDIEKIREREKKIR